MQPLHGEFWMSGPESYLSWRGYGYWILQVDGFGLIDGLVMEDGVLDALIARAGDFIALQRAV